MTDTKRVESYSLFEFCQQVEAAINEGYSFDFETNENFPTAYGSMLICGLTKAGKKVEAEVQTKVETTDETETVAQDVQEPEVVTEVDQTEAETQDVPEVVTEVETESQTDTPDEGTAGKRGPKPKAK